MKTLTSLIERLATIASRTPEETRQIADVENARAKYFLFFLVFGTLTALYAPVFVEHFRAWVHFQPDVPFNPMQWRALYGNYSPCGNRPGNDENCPADPENPLLWDSYFLRVEASHLDRINLRRFKDYWIGAVIPVYTVELARQKGATELLLGSIASSYRIFLDGEFVSGSTRVRDTNPILLNVPAAKFYSGKALHIAIQIIYDVDVTMPDVLNADGGGEGFVTHANANTYRNFMAFWEKVRPFSLLLSYAVIASLFLFFWMSAKVKQEYFYMAMFALMAAFYQARKMDILVAAFSTDANVLFEYVIRFYVAAFGMFLGLAFSRTRSLFFSIGVPLALAAPFVLYLSAPNMRYELYELSRLWLTPLLFFTGAIPCFLQAYFLKLQSVEGTYLPVRARRLTLFGLGLFALSAFYFAVSRDLVASGLPMFWDGSEHFIFMVLMGSIALTEYHQQEFLVSKAPVSEYHRRPVLPERLSGAILVADLKDSEAFYRYRAIHAQAANLVTGWRNQFYDAVYKNGGIIINKKGDELVAFFDHDKSPLPLVSALKTTMEVFTISEALEAEYRRQHLLPPGATGFYFRSALILGEIRPVWEKVGNSREAYWEEAGNTTPFVEGSRLMEIERQITTTGPTTQLLVRDEIANLVLTQERRIGGWFTLRDQPYLDKHGTEYRVAIFRPKTTREAAQGETPPERKAA